MAEQNPDRIADWKDQSGEDWVAYRARLDATLAVFGQAAIEPAAPAMLRMLPGNPHEGLLTSGYRDDRRIRQ